MGNAAMISEKSANDSETAFKPAESKLEAYEKSTNTRGDPKRSHKLQQEVYAATLWYAWCLEGAQLSRRVYELKKKVPAEMKGYEPKKKLQAEMERFKADLDNLKTEIENFKKQQKKK